ncbi:MAG: RNA methyltransferase [Erysipelotrichaceae bacterium]|nr:RNA methyltransferase [Erysipelotrichaceae bacterium]
MKIEGAISVKAAISNNKRAVTKVYIDKSKKTKDFNYIRKIAKQANIELIESTKEELETLAVGKTFGGIIAECGIRKNDEINEGDIFYLDGIEDPFNLGYIMRNLYAFGVKNIILPSRDYSNMEFQLLKSSAGAYDMLNVKIVDDVYSYIKELKNNNYKCYALKRGDDAKDIFETKFNNPALFMIGGEKRGIASNILDLADEYLYIPYGTDFRNSLNACNALAVVATLLFAQRKK